MSNHGKSNHSLPLTFACLFLLVTGFILGQFFGPTIIHRIASTEVPFPFARNIEGKHAGQLRRINGIEMAWVPPGEFDMGSPDGVNNGREDTPQHRVVLTTGFWMATTECTQMQWLRFMGNNPSAFQGMDRPVEFISWGACQKWLEKVNNASRLPEGWTWRLPTESQWEYACRAGTSTPYSFGKSLDAEQAAFRSGGAATETSSNPSPQGTTEAGSFAPNAWGLLDMHGNVSEWCHDWFGSYPSDLAIDPKGAVFSIQANFRGGSWSSSAKNCRSAARNAMFPIGSFDYLGFRPIVCRINPDQS
jgi:sulfatase modifying factor 1